MTHPLQIGIAGRALLPPETEIAMPLDEMIYRVTSQALADAGLQVEDLAGACMAASDLNDGRAISTMTLTGSTGSFRHTELRVCNDSLAAAQVGAAEIGSGSADAIMVCSWSKLSDATPEVIAPLAMEPMMHRDLGFHPSAIQGLSASRRTGTATLTRAPESVGVDVAAAVVLVGPSHRAPARARLTGVGGSMGSYLGTRGDQLAPLRAATERACRHAEVSLDDIGSVVVAGAHAIDDDVLAEVLGVAPQRLRRQRQREADLGYAAGLTCLVDALDDLSGQDARTLVVSAAGLALENTHAIVMEGA